MIENSVCVYLVVLFCSLSFVMGYAACIDIERYKRNKEKQEKVKLDEQKRQKLTINNHICEIKTRLAKLEKKKK